MYLTIYYSETFSVVERGRSLFGTIIRDCFELLGEHLFNYVESTESSKIGIYRGIYFSVFLLYLPQFLPSFLFLSSFLWFKLTTA